MTPILTKKIDQERQKLRRSQPLNIGDVTRMQHVNKQLCGAFQIVSEVM